MIEHPLLFASLALAAIATPGPTTLLALQNGAQGGMRAALPGMAGAVLSDAAAASLDSSLSLSAESMVVAR